MLLSDDSRSRTSSGSCVVLSMLANSGDWLAAVLVDGFFARILCIGLIGVIDDLHYDQKSYFNGRPCSSIFLSVTSSQGLTTRSSWGLTQESCWIRFRTYFVWWDEYKDQIVSLPDIKCREGLKIEDSGLLFNQFRSNRRHLARADSLPFKHTFISTPMRDIGYRPKDHFDLFADVSKSKSFQLPVLPPLEVIECVASAV